VLDNAVKYGRKGQVIQAGVTLAGSVVRIWVDDEGPGIQAGDRVRIWRPFVRLTPVSQRDVTGAGIGLAVVHELVTAQRGRAWVEEGSRGGARFVIELPGGAADENGENTPESTPSLDGDVAAPGATEATGA
jgi:signal transduction histidine kinase